MLGIDYCKKNNKILHNITKTFDTPTFVTVEKILKKKLNMLLTLFNKNFKIFYAMKANFNPNILKILKDNGLHGIETISPYEIQLAKKVGFKDNQIIFTGNNLSYDEIDQAKKMNVIINIGSLVELKYFAKKYKNSDLCIRINPGFGDGEFKQIITGGDKSKFGIIQDELLEVYRLIEDSNLNIIGLHCHLGSGFYNIDKFSPMVDYMFNLSKNFENIKFIDFGGGFGIRYKPDELDINLNDFRQTIISKIKKYNINNIDIIFEPGKYLVAESTFLVTKVTNIRKFKNFKIIAINTGFNHIIRPALYGSYHHIINIDKLHDNSLENVQIVGNICESTDIINKNIKISKHTQINDIIILLTAGAYCASMSSLYNLRPYAAEVLIKENSSILIRKRLNFTDTIKNLGFM